MQPTSQQRQNAENLTNQNNCRSSIFATAQLKHRPNLLPRAHLQVDEDDGVVLREELVAVTVRVARATDRDRLEETAVLELL